MVAVAQWRIARNKLKLDLFDRRMQVYTTIRGVLEDVCGVLAFDPPDDIPGRLMPAISSAKWLFGEDTYAYLQGDLHRHVGGVWMKCVSLKQLEHLREDQVASMKNEIYAHLDWCREELGRIDSRFAKFLTLSH